MKKNYLLLSDPHYHSWNTFSTIDENGVNSRLRIIINETERAVQEQIKSGGARNMIVAGDIFHVRGKLEPSVLNPVIDLFRNIVEVHKFKVYMIAGNHDLENDLCNRTTSAITALESVGVVVLNQPRYVNELNVLLIPWIKSIPALIERITENSDFLPPNSKENPDLIIHAPVDDVIFGLPSHGLSAKMLGDFNFDRVFAGHYHQHKDFGNGVYSIGATTHQTWSDVGSKAGFLLVTDEEVTYRASNAPKFVEIDENNYDEAALICDGNYVKVKVLGASVEDIESVRREIESYGAVGVVINSISKTSIVSREEDGKPTVRVGGVTISESISDYVKSMGDKNEKWVINSCIEIMQEVESLGIE